MIAVRFLRRHVASARAQPSSAARFGNRVGDTGRCQRMNVCRLLRAYANESRCSRPFPSVLEDGSYLNREYFR